MSSNRQTADVCLILEGTYPYVTGGVANWTHDLLTAQKDLSFHIVTLVPAGVSLRARYTLPRNVVSTTAISVHKPPRGDSWIKEPHKLFERLEGPLLRLQEDGGSEELSRMIEALAPHRTRLGSHLLMDSPDAWASLLRMYDASQPDSSFLDYFWTWRALLGGLYSVLLAEMPAARVYHAVSTGYAGLFAARANLETGTPAIVTEHGVYTNERRIEIAMADWLHDRSGQGLNIEKRRHTLRDLWVNTFIGYSRACYETCSRIITLYKGNQQFQLEDGAPPDKLEIIPNGIDYARFSAVERDSTPRPPTIALIGRVVPIKDVKTFIRAVAMLKERIPDVQALVLGPTDEDSTYSSECALLVEHLGLQNTVLFKGHVNLDDWLGRIDAAVLTSISEAQPLVILEAGAAGIPIVSTDVGACREMILGRDNEQPALGPGGAVTPLCNPAATAGALARLLADVNWHRSCSRAIQERVRSFYNKADVIETYSSLYRQYGDDSSLQLPRVA